MNTPEISEKLFQTWVLDHAQVLMKGSRQLDDLVLLYGAAFHDGWFQALNRAEPSCKTVENTAQSSDSQLLEFESKRPCTRPPARQNQIIVADRVLSYSLIPEI
jgi:hypothetical protein